MLALSAVVVLITLTVDAFLPRSDWYAPPSWRTNPAFRASVGDILTLDKPAHAGAAFVSTLLVALALHLGSGLSRRAAAVTAVAIVAVLWAGGVEVVQGFLAYRNFELLDLAASLLGSTLAVAFWFVTSALLHHWKAARTSPAPAGRTASAKLPRR